MVLASILICIFLLFSIAGMVISLTEAKAPKFIAEVIMTIIYIIALVGMANYQDDITYQMDSQIAALGQLQNTNEKLLEQNELLTELVKANMKRSQ
jgi:hypothetical protein